MKWHVRLATLRTVVRLREEQSSIILSCITKPVKLESGSSLHGSEREKKQANDVCLHKLRGHCKKAFRHLSISLAQDYMFFQVQMFGLSLCF